MNKIFFSLMLTASLLSNLAVYAAPEINGLTREIASKSGYEAADEFTMSETVGSIIRVLLGLVGTIFLFLTVYAGYLWMTAAGDSAKVDKAKGIIKTSVIGLVVLLAAYSITYFVLAYAFEVQSPSFITNP